MKSAGMDEAKAGIKIARRNINNLRYTDDITFMAESEEELKTCKLKDVSFQCMTKFTTNKKIIKKINKLKKNKNKK